MKRFSTSTRSAWLAVLLAGIAHSLAGQTIIDGFTSATNDRFANSGSFIGSAFDLSGVAISDSGRWVTMVSRNVFLSSNHYIPSTGTSVTFHLTNDPGGSSFSTTVGTIGQQVGSSDLWMGTLGNPLPTGYRTYGYATEDITNNVDFSTSAHSMQNAYLLGRSPSTTFPVSQDIAVGRNVLDTWFDSVDVSGTIDDAIGSVYGGANPYETFLQSGDSGGPMFIGTGNTLTIAGVNWFINQDPGNLQNGFSYVGNYDEQIGAFVTANAIPEPSTYAFMLGCAALFAVAITRRRRTHIKP